MCSGSFLSDWRASDVEKDRFGADKASPRKAAVRENGVAMLTETNGKFNVRSSR